MLLWYWLVALTSSSLKLTNSLLDEEYNSSLLLFLLRTFVTVNSVFVFSLEWLVPRIRNRNVDKDLRNADIFSNLFLLWLNPLINTAFKTDITERDLPEMEDSFSTSELSDKLLDHWNKSSRKGAVGMAFTIARTLRLELVALIGAGFAIDILTYIRPFLLQKILLFVREYNNDRSLPLSIGIYWTLLNGLVSLWIVFLQNRIGLSAVRLSVGVNGAIYGSVFVKALKLSARSRETKTASHIINLMTTDLGQVNNCMQQLLPLFTTPLEIVYCFIVLYSFLGFSFFGGVSIMIIVVPLNAYVSSKFRQLTVDLMKAIDERVKITTSMFSNAKSLKLYAWEGPWLDRLKEARNEHELVLRKKVMFWLTILTGIWSIVPYFIAAGVFGAFLYMEDRPLTADIIFPSLSLFNLLSGPLIAIPYGITMLIQSKVSFQRFADLLSADEQPTDQLIHLPPVNDPKSKLPVVKFSNTTVSWSESEDAAVALDEIDFEAYKRQLLCVIGKVGAGKSALVKTLCGELFLKQGSVSIRGNIAYVPQEPWLLNQSVKDNILFRNKYDPEFYQKTLEACDLVYDIKNLPDGDETEVGERGISLSGGQKARVSLARAVYARADVYVLDDILSAVDEHVGKHLIDHVLGKHGLLASKTIVLATNNVKVLAEADNIILIEDKKIRESGSPLETIGKKGPIYELMKEFGAAQHETVEELKEEIVTVAVQEEPEEQFDDLRRASIESFRSISEEATKELERRKKSQDAVESGAVKSSVYLRYFQASGIGRVTLSVIMIIMVGALTTLGSVWLKLWSDQSITGATSESLYYLGVYVLIGIVYGVIHVSSTYIAQAIAGLKAAEVLHDNMAQMVLRSPMSFFEQTPLGQILNRFTTDINEIDNSVANTLASTFRVLMTMFFAVLVVCYSTPIVTIAVLPVTILYWYYQKFYLVASRQLKRLSSAARSPMMANFEESVKGIKVIRAFEKDRHFIHENNIRSDLVLKTVSHAASVDRWLALRLGIMGSLFVLFTGISGVYMAKLGLMTEGVLGLGMSNAMIITSQLWMVVRQSIEIERRGVTIERIFQYHALKSEAPEIVENNRPPAYWPSEGRITFDKFSTRYKEGMKLVLKDINLDIKPREKIGVVGRTGAGKSTLTLSLFRLIEPASGTVVVDNINTNDIGLLDLRHNMSIIPQDAQIFSGTVRDNLDPFRERDDTDLWRVLELCHLKDHVSGMEGGLDAALADSGENLSKGQAQLICLARALLHDSNILVLDEATASVDVETDKIIQQTIRTELKHKTIITIAHRLNTIMDSDRIVVLEKGEIAEFDSPQNLLAKPESLFYGLCEKAGLVGNEDKN
ncbi:ATP-binding cassette glutathione S-conjugate transporter YCF1 [Sugiyamaella lignohabitans]|uniref:ATP-binding cassette glutathione S-conjugate transporter YCF1 n=1 Tax=Sugiyamaella lignohabitans TaxID=796027 RepID=A0A167F104_9ASCO|nr:ATP-binding cassette glutathione S-conjugate transporter YCF1 [Sugiyamaella lignohabitans]ANB14688.1 ATP-binding cassette glutathione S-conjugate transporter YCF1 [Sugiyamaella lignohabitans]